MVSLEIASTTASPASSASSTWSSVSSRREGLGRLAANLKDVFQHAVVMSDGEHVCLGVTVIAESHEEADATLEEFLGAFGAAAGLDDYVMDGSSNGQGIKRHHELIEEIESNRRGG